MIPGLRLRRVVGHPGQEARRHGDAETRRHRPRQELGLVVPAGPQPAPVQGYGRHNVDTPVPGAHVRRQLRAQQRRDGPQVAVFEGVDCVPHRPLELKHGRDSCQRGGRFGALAASAAKIELDPARTARWVANPGGVIEAPVAEQLSLPFAVDAGLREDQVDGLPKGDIQG